MQINSLRRRDRYDFDVTKPINIKNIQSLIRKVDVDIDQRILETELKRTIDTKRSRTLNLENTYKYQSLTTQNLHKNLNIYTLNRNIYSTLQAQERIHPSASNPQTQIKDSYYAYSPPKIISSEKLNLTNTIKNLDSLKLMSNKITLPSLKETRLEEEKVQQKQNDLVDKVLDRYKVTKMTLNQAKQNILGYSVKKWIQVHHKNTINKTFDDAQPPQSPGPKGVTNKTPNNQQIKVKGDGNREIQEFAKELFRVWDSKEFGKIKLRLIIKNFIALGLAASEELAFSFFKQVLQSALGKSGSDQGLKDSEITVEEFIKLFKGDQYQDQILYILNKEVRTMREFEQEKQKQIDFLNNFNKRIEEEKNKLTSQLSIKIDDSQSISTRSKEKSPLSKFRNRVIGSSHQNSIVINEGIQDFQEEYEFLSKLHPDKMILLKDYLRDKKKLSEEQRFLTKVKYLDEIFEDIRKYYQPIKDIKATQHKIDTGKTIDQNEQVKFNHQKIFVSKTLRQKYGLQCMNYFKEIYDCIIEIEKVQPRTEFQVTQKYLQKYGQPEIFRNIKILINELGKKQGEQEGFQFPNEKLIDQVALVDNWWNQLDQTFQKEVDKKTFSRFCVSKEIIKKEIEIDRVAKCTIQEPISDGTLKKSQFFKLFTKAILKGAIMNIYYYVTNNQQVGETAVPTQLKVLKFQRNLLLGGLKHQKEIHGVNCQQLITGLMNPNLIAGDLHEMKKLSLIKNYMEKEKKELDKISNKIFDQKEEDLLSDPAIKTIEDDRKKELLKKVAEKRERFGDLTIPDFKKNSLFTSNKKRDINILKKQPVNKTFLGSETHSEFERVIE